MQWFFKPLTVFSMPDIEFPYERLTQKGVASNIVMRTKKQNHVLMTALNVNERMNFKRFFKKSHRLHSFK